MPICETLKAVQGILSHYSCPTSCHAFCCKIADINLDENDLELLKQSSNYRTDKVMSCDGEGEHHYKISPPCPFLNIDRCSAYEERPAICRLFPFNICNEPDVLLLFPCDMGASIFKDYAGYSNVILKQPISETTAAAFEESHISFRSRMNNGSSSTIPMLMLKINRLVQFKEYLGSGFRFQGNPEIPV